MAEFDIIIGGTAQPATFDIVISGAPEPPDPDAGKLIGFDLPDAPKGSVLLAFIVRGEEPLLAPAGWDLVIDSAGDDGLFLDVFARMVDDDDIRRDYEEVRRVYWGSLVGQQMQGQIFVYENSSPSTIIESFDTDVFTADATPPAVVGGSTTQQAVNTVMTVWSAAGEIDFTAPAGYTVVDEYTSAEVEERTIMLARKIAGVTHTVAAINGAASPAATGRVWTVVLRNGPPPPPPELFDPVPGHIGLI